ncbi:DUF2076 domain-containing protein [Dryocola sp. LX212]|jgi:hypothetical protein
MQSAEQRLIDGLFERLKKADDKSAPREPAAEQLIQQHLAQQPGAAYYMAQTILIQEAAMKQLNARIHGLEGQIAQLQQTPRQQQSSGGFLAGLFGGGANRGADPVLGSQQYQQNAIPGTYNAPQMSAPGYAAPRGGTGFMAGALQTAAGVAGGVIMADMLTSMFHHTQPEELVNIINEPTQPVDNTAVNAVEDYNKADDSQFLNQDAGLPQDERSDFADPGFGGFGNDDFGNDDDNLI